MSDAPVAHHGPADGGISKKNSIAGAVLTRTSSLFWKRMSNPFPIAPEQLSHLADEQDQGKQLEALGGLMSVSKILLSNLDTGISGDIENQVLIRKRLYPSRCVFLFSNFNLFLFDFFDP
jgi:hypothetical protein